MPRNTGPDFNQAAGNGDSRPQPGGNLTIVIRTDARHATASLKDNLFTHLKNRQNLPSFNEAAQNGDTPSSLEKRIESAVHGAYEIWGKAVLDALKDCLDYDRYGLGGRAAGSEVHFHNARELAKETVSLGSELAKNVSDNEKLPTVYVSLDDLIKGTGMELEEIAFSRLFSLDGRNHFGYEARPGYKSLNEQIQAVRNKVDALAGEYGEKVPVVLLEDNVRHARMLNWVIDLMDQGGIFENGELAGISTCFCCAPQEEREAIQLHGKTVPLAIAIDYKDEKVDVMTTRDLLFDGYVVDIDGEKKRLPAIFMDIGTLFKIRPGKEEEFLQRVVDANMVFCKAVEQDFGVSLPLSWFATADAISYVTGFTPDTPMTYILENIKEAPAQDNRPDNEKGCGPCQSMAP